MVELSPGASVALGVVVGLLSTSIQSIGLTLQRKSHLLEEEKEDHYERRPAYKRRRWQLGMLMFIVANLVGSTIQITTLPLPVLSTLQASGLVFNSICATLILSEPFTRWSLAGTVLVASGALLIGIFGAIPEPSHNLNQLLHLLGRHQFIIWMVATLVVVVILLVTNWFLKRLHPRPTPRIRLIRGIFFGCISGILSAHSLLIAKSAVELLVRTIIDRHNEFKRWQSWMILVGLVVFALTQLYYMHRGLKLCSTSVLYPLVFCVYNIIAILDGLIYFHQSSRLSSLQAGLIALGTVILLGGVVSLSWRLEENEEEPPSPLAHKHHRIAPPQNVLTPGLALVHTMEDETDDGVDIEDVEPGEHGALVDQLKRRSADERTPLLARAPTGPAVTIARTKRKRPSINTEEFSPGTSPPPRRPPLRGRRVTIAQETNDIWNELNDREDLPSPLTRSTEFERRLRAGTLPARRRNPSNTTWLEHMRRTSWLGGFGGDRKRSASLGKRPAQSTDALMHHPDPQDETQSDAEAEVHPGSHVQQGTRSGDAGGDWLKLKWWRKRWRDRERRDEERGDDERL